MAVHADQGHNAECGEKGWGDSEHSGVLLSLTLTVAVALFKCTEPGLHRTKPEYYRL